MAFDWAKKWLFSVFLKKAIKRGIIIGAAWLTSKNIGIDVNDEAIFATVWAGLEAVRQWLKVKTDWKWL